MAASEHINQHQLRGLISRDMQIDDTSGRDYTIGELDVENIFQDDSERYESLYDSIKNEGIKVPLHVSIKKNLLIDGHHRAIVARDLGIDTIPIINQD
jgi:ParB-like chromosome segregation protein Spo0J